MERAPTIKKETQSKRFHVSLECLPCLYLLRDALFFYAMLCFCLTRGDEKLRRNSYVALRSSVGIPGSSVGNPRELWRDPQALQVVSLKV